MSFKSILSLSYRMYTPAQMWCQRSVTTASAPLYFRLTQGLGAEPLKKKKRLDPMIIRQREERKKKKIEKMIRRLEKNAGQLKPIDELEVPHAIVKEIDIRKRHEVAVSKEEEEQRVALAKQWSQYKYKQHLAEVTMIKKLIASRDRALEELRRESEELWLEAIQVDPTLLPLRAKGPVSTAPIKGYETPDGEYHNVTRKWD